MIINTTFRVLQGDINKAIADYCVVSNNICRMCVVSQAVLRMFPEADFVVTSKGQTTVYAGKTRLGHLSKEIAQLKYPKNSQVYKLSDSSSPDWKYAKPCSCKAKIVTR